MAEKVCPVWIGYLLASPIRKLFQHPNKILSPYISEGMKVADIGCGMGFFSLPLAKMVGETGKVICADLQEKMLKSLEKRAKKAGIFERIEPRLCYPNSPGIKDIEEEIDFVLLFAVIHEVPEPYLFFSEIYGAIKPGGKVLLAEPKGHVTQQEFERTVSVAEQAGLRIIDRPDIAGSHAVVFEKALF